MTADRKILAAAFAAILMLTAGPARAAVGRPTPTAPAEGAVSQFLPAFAWTPISGADRYEFQIAADEGMNSPVLGQGKDDFLTRNTRATLVKTVPNGTYWWRVRAVAADGSVSAWTSPRSFTKNWNSQPALQSPSDGQTLNFPASPVVLRWSGVPGAAHYLVSVASDPALGSLVFKYSNQDDPNGPPNVAGNSAAITAALAPGTYYWAVQPVDAEGNHGVPTPVASFGWVWPSATTPVVTDLDSSPEVFDPKFSWNPVPGAARYEVEINSDVDFALSGKVCCNGTTIATSLSPTGVFKDNDYYWRVRAIDPDGNAGVWNVWHDPNTGSPTFRKTFDQGPPGGPVPGTSIKNLHLRDNLTDDTLAADEDNDLSNGYQTRVPVVAWDPVPGASSYEVTVAPWNGTSCLWAIPLNIKKTSVPEWAPLGYTSANPVNWQGTLARDSDHIDPRGTDPAPAGDYCFAVRARSDRAAGNQEVWGSYTYLQNGNTDSADPVGPAFTWTDYPDPADPGNSDGCPDLSGNVYLCAGDYLLPQTGVTHRTPFFTWAPVAGAQSYFVVVAKDQGFVNVIDEGFTWIPAYAPRNSLKPTTYTDETTSYYWAVLPADDFLGTTAPAPAPSLDNQQPFDKQSLPPTLLYPAAAQVFSDQPTFRWSPAEGARRYRLQVASDVSFSNLLDDVTTDATSYSSNTTYPADTVLYWRVRADDENLNGLTWSAIGMFERKLDAPMPSASNPASGDMLPVWAWSPVQGASSYDVTLDGPDGTHRYFSGFRTPAVSFIKMTGTGVFQWRVRAEFPTSSGGETPGAYSPTQTFTRTIGQPVNTHTDADPKHVLLSWDPRLGAKEYKVQIASTPDFSRRVEETSTDNASYAPTMTQYGYSAGGTLYWRVAAVDEDRNQGDWSQTGQIRMLPRMRISVLGLAKHGKQSRFSIRVQKFAGGSLARVVVRVTGKGMKARSGRTNARGSLTLMLKPKRKGSKLTFRATKAGYQPAYFTVKVR